MKPAALLRRRPWTSRLLVCGVFLSLGIRDVLATEPEPGAKRRAELYQAEAVKSFADHHWVIARNRTGEFIAVHSLSVDGGASFGFAMYGPRSEDNHTDSFGTPVAYATVTFRPDSVQHTKCVVHSVGYLTSVDQTTGKRSMSGPYEINSDENKRFIERLIEMAEKSLIHHHPEYGRR